MFFFSNIINRTRFIKMSSSSRLYVCQVWKTKISISIQNVRFVKKSIDYLSYCVDILFSISRGPLPAVTVENTKFVRTRIF